MFGSYDTGQIGKEKLLLLLLVVLGVVLLLVLQMLLQRKMLVIVVCDPKIAFDVVFVDLQYMSMILKRLLRVTGLLGTRTQHGNIERIVSDGLIVMMLNDL